MSFICVKKTDEFQGVLTFDITMPFYMWLPFSICVEGYLTKGPEGLTRQGVFSLSDEIKSRIDSGKKLTEKDFEMLYHNGTRDSLLFDINELAELYKGSPSKDNKDTLFETIISLIPANFICTRKIIMRQATVMSIIREMGDKDSNWRTLCDQLMHEADI